MHVRRGDACRCLRGCCWSNLDGAGRKCLPVDEYVALAALLADALDVRHVLIATEDATDLARGAALLRARSLVPLWQPWPRAAFSDGTRALRCTAGGDGFRRIEQAMDGGPGDMHGLLWV